MALLSVSALACSSPPGDPPIPLPSPNPLGTGSRIRDLTPPAGGDKADGIPKNPNHPSQNANVDVTGVVVTATDLFDETKDGKSLGTIYVQDVGSPPLPFSGIDLYSASFLPGTYHAAPGDVVDLTGPYQDYAGPSTGFPIGKLPELAKPLGSFRYEYSVPAPVPINIADLEVTDVDHFVKGSQWLGMLVTVKNVALTISGTCTPMPPATTCPVLTNDGKGRVSAPLTSDASSGPAVVNELYDLKATDFAVAAGKSSLPLASVTGIVTFFFNFHIAPRSAADIVVATP